MSRVGRAPIQVPDKVKVEIKGADVTVTGPKGSLSRTIHPSMSINQEGNTLMVSRPSDSKLHKSLHGLTRMLIYNMVEGVTKGYERALEIVGVGYRVEAMGKHLKISVGFSHPILIKETPGLKIIIDDQTHFRVTGIDKEMVGMMASKIRSFRPPEPYKGKGIRYKGEVVRKKAGKTAA